VGNAAGDGGALVRRVLERCGALLLLPLSVVPFVLLGPQIAESHRNFERTQASDPLPAPTVVPSARETALWKPLPVRGPRAVGVVAYAGVGGDAPAVTRLAFARQMEMLARAGFRTVSIHQYSRWRRGLPAGLPPRPVLITFDGGRLDTFRGADRVLQRHGFRATIFPTVGAVARGDRHYLRWRELQAMERSGRWDVQPGGFVEAPVTVDSSGRAGEPYAYRRFTRSAGVESFADWQERVTGDIFAARRTMVAQGFDPVAFSVPGGNYGQRGSNDARIAGWLRPLLRSQFSVYLAAGDEHRFRVSAATTASALYGWLR
jgi:peptidoglycan/xylan/chitin deacetylase (PgdA/CDA1 family)